MEMLEQNNFTTISSRKHPTHDRLKHLGNLGMNYDKVINLLIDYGAARLREEAEEAAYQNTQK
jgi:hypothetical protein